MASNGKNNSWLVAEPIVLLSGLFTILVWLSLPYQPIYTLLLLSIFFPVIPSVALVSLVIWKYRNTVSNTALAGGVALSCFSWLQFVLPIGLGFGLIPTLVLLFLLLGSVCWITAGSEQKRPVNN